MTGFSWHDLFLAACGLTAEDGDKPIHGRSGTLTTREMYFAALYAELGDAEAAFSAIFDPEAELYDAKTIDCAASLLSREDVALEVYIQKRLRAAMREMDDAIVEMQRASEEAGFWRGFASAQIEAARTAEPPAPARPPAKPFVMPPGGRVH